MKVNSDNVYLKILFLNRWVGCQKGGTEKHIIGLASSFVKRGHDVNIMTTEGQELNSYRNRISVWDVPKNKWEKPFSRAISEDPFLLFYSFMFLVKTFAIMLQASIRGVKFDIISIHAPLEGMFLLFFGWIFRVPHIWVLEGYSKLETWLAHFAKSTIAISDSLAEHCWKNHSYKYPVIPVGTDTNLFNSQGKIFKKPENKIVIINVSRISEHKRIDVLIKAASQLLSMNYRNKFEIRIIGDGKDKLSLEKMVENEGLTEHVTFLGRVSESDLPKHYRSSDIFVNCELAVDEYWVTCVEAISCGLPVIWTSKSNYNDKISIRKWGIEVPEDNPELLARMIIKVGEDMNLRNKLSTRGLKMAKSFSWDKLANSYEKVYKHVDNKFNN